MRALHRFPLGRFLLSFFASLAALPLYSQPQNEDLGKGYEPSMATNRRTAQNNPRLVVCWMDGNLQKLEYKVSSDQGTLFEDTQTIWLTGATHFDPTLSPNTENGDIFFGFLGSPTNSYYGTSRTLRLSDGQFGPDSNMMLGDRPWLLGVRGTPHVIWPSGSQDAPLPMFKSRKGSVGADGLITWGNTVTVANSVSGLLFSNHGAFARGNALVGGTQQTLLLGALQFSSTNPHAGGSGFYAYRSADAGSTWNPVPGINLAGLQSVASTSLDGYIAARDFRLAAHHAVGGDVVGENSYAYFSFARTEQVDLANKAMVLYCLRSTSDGTSFPTLTRVFTPPAGGGVTFGEVPTNEIGAWGPGFFRIGRVWSTIDGNGTLHVVWMDNREGRFSAQEPRRDKWRVRRAFSSDKGLTWTVDPNPVSDPGICRRLRHPTFDRGAAYSAWRYAFGRCRPELSLHRLDGYPLCLDGGMGHEGPADNVSQVRTLVK